MRLGVSVCVCVRVLCVLFGLCPEAACEWTRRQAGAMCDTRYTIYIYREMGELPERGLGRRGPLQLGAMFTYLQHQRVRCVYKI